ncbi:DUF4407 domain-containing protein [Nocardia amamiensis]|uniref:DUF4407 domain-containing protein n=1 Tax=Nocardia amamiensis TaxID=404578 RepID=UPI0009FC872F|nr:DUF4407 domain-containing protein [Nocardia amamiensis]
MQNSYSNTAGGTTQPALDTPGAGFRPVASQHGVGVRLRGLIGIREEILDWIPEERAKYTRLGAIVLNTGLMAGLSFLVALQSISDVFWLLLLPVAAFWVYLVVSLDSWLIAGTHGLLSTGRMLIFLPRLFIAVLIGFIIAEPLLLWVFKPAIHKEVLETRGDEISIYTGRLTFCNPASGRPVADPGCQDFLVSVPNPPHAAQDELVRLTGERDRAASKFDTDSREWKDLETHAINECAGTAGVGLTGVAGNGPECQRNREKADQFRADRKIDQQQSNLDDLNAKVEKATVDVALAEGTYGRQVAAAIDERVQQRKRDQGSIGLLDEERGLSALSDENTSVLFAQWLVRLLLLAIDCLPVLAKMLSGVTAYDQRVYRQTEAGKNLHERYLGLREAKDGAVIDVEMRGTERWLQVQLEKIDEADRSDRAEREIHRRDQIASLASRLRRKGMTG